MFISETYQREKLESHSANCLGSSDFCLSLPLVVYHLTPCTVCAVYTSMQEWRELGSVFEKYVAPTMVDHCSSPIVAASTGKHVEHWPIESRSCHPTAEELNRSSLNTCSCGTREIFQLLQPERGESSRLFV